MYTHHHVKNQHPHHHHHKRNKSIPLIISFICGMCFFAVSQYTTTFITSSQNSKLRGSASGDDFFTSRVPAKEELGRAGWTILHRISSKFSKEPDNEEKKNMKQFLTLFAKLYPCPDCAKHFQQYIEKHPPALGSNEGLMKWMCKAHNEVNERNNKDIFPCKMDDLITRWGACGCDEDESVTISKILERRRRSREQKNNIY